MPRAGPVRPTSCTASSTLFCHQWAFWSFFVLGPQLTLTREQLVGLGLDPVTFTGDAQLGWRLAFSERNLAIFSGVLAFGLLYATRWRGRGLRPAGYVQYALLVAPMAVDGLTQLGGWRESAGNCGWPQACCSGSPARLAALPELCGHGPFGLPGRGFKLIRGHKPAWVGRATNLRSC